MLRNLDFSCARVVFFFQAAMINASLKRLNRSITVVGWRKWVYNSERLFVNWMMNGEFHTILYVLVVESSKGSKTFI